MSDYKHGENIPENEELLVSSDSQHSLYIENNEEYNLCVDKDQGLNLQIDEHSEYNLCDETDKEHSIYVDTTLGTYNHNLLYNRDLENQHPIKSITGLQDELNQRVLIEENKSLIDNDLIKKIEDINLDGVIYDSNYVHTDNNFSSSYKNKLEGIEFNAQKNTVNSVNGLQGDIILSKDHIGLNNVDNTSDIDKPISRSTQNALDTKANMSDISTVGKTNNYNDLDNKPFVPTNTSDLNNNSGFITDSALEPYIETQDVYRLLEPYITEVEVDGKLEPYAKTEDIVERLEPYITEAEVDEKLEPYAKAEYVEEELAGKANYEDLSRVAITGSYNDLTNKPSIPSNVSDLVNDTGFVTDETLESYVLKNEISDVATTGSYNDLINKPSIPNNLSELVNDTGFVTGEELTAYEKTENVDQKLSTKQDLLTAGKNVEITKDNVINVDVPPNVLVDDVTITKNSEDVITTIGVKTKSDTIKYDWEGTLAEWQSGRANGSIPNDWFCFITDDEQEIVGQRGDSATIKIGKVEIGDIASVTNSGDENDAVLDFVLPKGEQGIQGIQGEKGEVGPSNVLTIGSVTSGDEPFAEITGDSPNQILNLVLPKGEKGEDGRQGVDGEKGETGPSNVLTIGSVTKGEEASATITGVSPSQELNLVLPKGDKGDKGETGEKGEAGEKGEKGDKGDNGLNGGVDVEYLEDSSTLSFYNVFNELLYPEWGNISGDINNQTDLQELLSTKLDVVDMPTKISELINDKLYVTQAEVLQAIANIPQFKMYIVDILPEIGEKMTLYLMPKEGLDKDVYNEYVWIEQTMSFEFLGSTAIDLSDYITKSQLDSTIGDIDSILDEINGEVV